MKQSFFSRLVLPTVAVVSIGICIAGYQHSQKNTASQSASTGKLVTKRDDAKLQEIKGIVPTLYQNQAMGILSTTVNDEQVEDLLTNFKNSQGQEPLDDSLKAVEQELNTIQQKIEAQKQVGQFYTQGLNWTTFDNNVALNLSTSTEAIDKAKELVAKTANDEWATLANNYIAYAQNQILAIQKVQAKLATMITDGKVNSQTTVNEYYEAVRSLRGVTDAAARQQLIEQLNQVNTSQGFDYPLSN